MTRYYSTDEMLERIDDLIEEARRLTRVHAAAEALSAHFKRGGLYAMDRDTRHYMADLESALDSVKGANPDAR